MKKTALIYPYLRLSPYYPIARTTPCQDETG